MYITSGLTNQTKSHLFKEQPKEGNEEREKKTPRVKKPIPVVIPIAVAIKIAKGSLAPPAADLKRIKLNVPAIATLVPRFPFTKKMIMEIIAGKRDSVMTNSLV